MTEVLLSLGSNQEPYRHLQAAATALRDTFGPVRFSPVYETAAVGFDGPAFLNAGAWLDTDWDVYRLDRWLHELEDALGRKRDVPRFSSRTIDIDIVFFGDAMLKGPGNLQIPRPELKHAFVLKPLTDLAPDFVVPGQGLSLRALWQQHPEAGAFYPAGHYALV
ncbi:2-amino-4-hydroxy-6-hydroxymethyldihydropteridine diphosphokinase [Ahniella affigens]|uniref:2-amino-4-hydroxy-6-hydroxymethyldihydropteridine pyrophosphokinase n=1 Tax=Ahniella affigens TaxID=2021234 RepID=A0A2P1PXD7_9GAMM|nr:2-amino-4-hydroxy-6-hydroxymethyldihydropteridine diphosphokinase [Ahniella affigens]AVP99509.1 2-amino-4-hydroxy-6-hydroxymethyldihydropteridine diphosphokinase [Ahniella affigens]